MSHLYLDGTDFRACAWCHADVALTGGLCPTCAEREGILMPSPIRGDGTEAAHQTPVAPLEPSRNGWISLGKISAQVTTALLIAALLWLFTVAVLAGFGENP